MYGDRVRGYKTAPRYRARRRLIADVADRGTRRSRRREKKNDRRRVIVVDVAKLDADVRAKIQAGELDDAEAAVRKALKRSRKQPRLYYLLALSVMKRNPLEAAEALERSAALDGASIDTRTLQLRLATESGNEERIAAVAEAAILAAPGSARVHEAAAKALFKARRYLGSARAWQQLDTLTPGGPAVLLGILRALAAASRQAKPSEAWPEGTTDWMSELFARTVERLADFEAGTAIDFLPYLPEGHVDVAAATLAKAKESGIIDGGSFAVARVLRELRRRADSALVQAAYEAAARDYKMMLRLDPESEPVTARFRQCIARMMTVGNRHYSAGDHRAAAAAFEAVLALDGGNARASRWLAFSLERTGAYEGAADAWIRFADLSREPEGWTRAMNAVLKTDLSPRKLERFAAIRPHLSADSPRIRQGDMFVSALVRASVTKLKDGDIREAMRSLRAMQLWNPDHPAVKLLRQPLRNALIGAVGHAAETGASDETLLLTEALIEVDPANVAALQRLGRAYFSRRNIDKALGVYRKLAALQPDQTVYESRIAACLTLIREKSAA